MSDLPFLEIPVDEHHRLRFLDHQTDESKFKWHQDEKDREIFVIRGAGWQLQMDNELPKRLNTGYFYKIPQGVHHRVIPGNGVLAIRIRE